MALNLTAEFDEGADARGTDTKCPYLPSSPAWLAWRAGNEAVAPSPMRVTSGRGQTIRIDGELFIHRAGIDRIVAWKDR